MDAGSDILDWVDALKWDDGTALLVVVIMLSTLAWNFAARRRRRGPRSKVIEFIDQGQELILVFRRGLELNAEQLDNWVEPIEPFLQKNVGSAAAAEFRTASDASVDDRLLYQSVDDRMTALKKILHDLQS